MSTRSGDTTLVGIGTTFDYSLPFEPMCRMIADAGFRAITIGGGSIAHSGTTTKAVGPQCWKRPAGMVLRIDSLHAPFGQDADLSVPDVWRKAKPANQALLFQWASHRQKPTRDIRGRLDFRHRACSVNGAAQLQTRRASPAGDCSSEGGNRRCGSVRRGNCRCASYRPPCCGRGPCTHQRGERQSQRARAVCHRARHPIGGRKPCLPPFNTGS